VVVVLDDVPPWPPTSGGATPSGPSFGRAGSAVDDSSIVSPVVEHPKTESENATLAAASSARLRVERSIERASPTDKA
jgi:hypothetical protein